MKHFAEELTALLAGPPRQQQTELADKVGMTKSKMSRILSDRISCDRETLDQILSGFVSRESKTRLVAAYLKDLASPGALALLRGGSGDQWAGVEFNRLSKKGDAALRGLLKSDHLMDFEKIVINLATAFGVENG
jgi:hypothetical protein